MANNKITYTNYGEAIKKNIASSVTQQANLERPLILDEFDRIRKAQEKADEESKLRQTEEKIAEKAKKITLDDNDKVEEQPIKEQGDKKVPEKKVVKPEDEDDSHILNPFDLGRDVITAFVSGAQGLPVEITKFTANLVKAAFYKPKNAEEAGKGSNNLIVNQFIDTWRSSRETRRSEFVGGMATATENINELQDYPKYVEYADLASKYILNKNSLTNEEYQRFYDLKDEIDPKRMTQVLEKWQIGGIKHSMIGERTDIKRLFEKNIGSYYNAFDNELEKKDGHLKNFTEIQEELKDTPIVDQWYQERKSKHKLDSMGSLLDTGAWAYAMPSLVGSSNSSPKMIAANAAMTVTVPVVTALSGGMGDVPLAMVYTGITGAQVFTTYQSNESEALANAGDTYTQHLRDNISKNLGADINDPEVMKNFLDAFRKNDRSGITKGLSDEDAFNVIANVETGNHRLEALKRDALYGLNKSYQLDKALSLYDIGEAIISTPVLATPGKVLLKQGGQMAKGIAKNSYKALELAAKTNKALKYAKNTIDVSAAIANKSAAIANKIAKPFKYVADAADAVSATGETVADVIGESITSEVGKKIFKGGRKVLRGGIAVTKAAARQMAASPFEGVEEITQTITSKKQQRGDYEYDLNDSVFDDIKDTYGNSFEGILLLSGIKTDPTFVSQEELNENWFSGIALGLGQGSIQNGIAKSMEWAGKKAAEQRDERHLEILKEAATRSLISRDRFTRDALYANRYATNEKLMKKSFEALKSNLPEGVTKEMVEEEEKRYEVLGEIMSSDPVKKVLKTLDIKPGSESHNVYAGIIGNALDMVSTLSEDNKTTSKIKNDHVNKIVADAYKDIVDSGLSERTITNEQGEEVKEIIPQGFIQSYVNTLLGLEGMKKLLNNYKEWINDDTFEIEDSSYYSAKRLKKSIGALETILNEIEKELNRTGNVSDLIKSKIKEEHVNNAYEHQINVEALNAATEHSNQLRGLHLKNQGNLSIENARRTSDIISKNMIDESGLMEESKTDSRLYVKNHIEYAAKVLNKFLKARKNENKKPVETTITEDNLETESKEKEGGPEYKPAQELSIENVVAQEQQDAGEKQLLRHTTTPERVGMMDSFVGTTVKVNGRTGKLSKVNDEIYELEDSKGNVYEFSKENVQSLSPIELINKESEDAKKEDELKRQTEIVETPARPSKYKIEIVSESEVIVNDVKYRVNTNSFGNITHLTPENNTRQKITNNKLIIAVEIERNKTEFKSMNVVSEEPISEVLIRNNYENLSKILDAIWDVNFNETVASGLDKLYNSEKLTDVELLQVSLWLSDCFDRIYSLVDKNNSAIENETILNAYNTADIINSLLYNIHDVKIKENETTTKDKRGAEEVKSSISTKENKKSIEDQVKNAENIAETKESAKETVVKQEPASQSIEETGEQQESIIQDQYQADPDVISDELVTDEEQNDFLFTDQEGGDVVFFAGAEDDTFTAGLIEQESLPQGFDESILPAEMLEVIAKEKELQDAGKPQNTESNDVPKDESGTNVSPEIVNQNTESNADNNKPVAEKTQNELDQEECDRLAKQLQMLLRGQLSFGVNPEILIVGAKLISIKMRMGVRKIQPIAEELLKSVGEAVRPFIVPMYMVSLADAQQKEGFDSSEYSSREEIYNFDVNNFDKPVIEAEEKRNEHIVKNVETNDQQLDAIVDAIGRDKFSHTLFYKYDADAPMNIPGFKNLRPGRELSEITTRPDFVEKGNFYFHVVNNNIYIIIEYNGKQYAAAIRTLDSLEKAMGRDSMSEDQKKIIRDELTAFRNKIINNFNKLEKGQRLVPVSRHGINTVDRTNGAFKQNQDSKGNNVFRRINEVKGLMIDLTKSITESIEAIGVGSGIKNKFIIDTQKGVMNGIGNAGSIYLYIKNSLLNNQTIPNVPVQLNHRKMSMVDKNATKEQNEMLYDFILNAIIYDTYDIKDPVANRLFSKSELDSLFDFIVNFGEQTLSGLDKSENVITEKIFTIEKGNLLFGGKVAKISDIKINENLRREVKDFIKNNLTWSFNKEHLYSNGEYVKLKHVFPETYQNLVNQPNINKIVIIPGVLEFTKEDFEKPTLDWYVNNGKLLTDLHDDLFTNAFMFAADVAIQDGTVEELGKAQEKSVPTMQEIVESTTKNEENKLPSGTKAQRKAELAKKLTGAKRSKIGSKYEVADIEKEREIIMRMLGLGEDEVEILDSVLMMLSNGSQLHGLMKEDSIVLSSSMEKGTAYHEAFHRLSLLLLSPFKRQKLYDDYRKANNLSDDISDYDVEEMLAEDFREYMLADSTNKPFYTITKYYKKAVRFIETIFGINNYTKERIFSDLKAGVFSGKKIDKKSLSEFKRKYEEGTPFKVGDIKLSAPEVNEISNSLTAALLTLNNIKTAADLKSGINWKLLKDYIELMGSTEEGEEPDSQTNLMHEISINNNFENVFKPKIENILKNIAIHVKSTDIDAETETKDVDGKGVVWDKDTATVNPIHNMMTEIKILIATLPYSKIEDGKVVAIESTLTGLPLMIDFKASWNKMIYKLHNSVSAEAMMEKILHLSRSKDPSEAAFFTTLYDRINSEISNASSVNVGQNYLTKFFNTVKKHSANYIMVQVKKVENGFKYILSYPNSKTGQSKSIKNWSNNFKSNNNFWKDTDKGRLLNEDSLKAVVDNYNKNVYEKANKIVTGKLKLNEKETLEMKELFINIMNSLGIVDMNLDVLNNLLMYRPTASAEKSTDAVEFAKYLINKVKDPDSGEMRGSISSFVEGLPKSFATSNKSNHNRIFFTPAVREISKQCLLLSPAISSSVMGPDGNMYFNIIENNTITDKINDISENIEVFVGNVKTKLRDALNKTIFVTGTNGRGSLVMNFLNSEANKGKKLKVVNYINYKGTSSRDGGKGFYDLTEAEDILLKMCYTNNDVMPFPTLADKKSYGGITAEGFKLFHEIFTPIKYKDQNGNIQVKWELNDAVSTQFFNYAKAEFDSILLAYTLEEEYKDQPDKHVDNYLKNGKRFRNFNLIVSKDGRTLNQILDAAEKNGTIKETLDSFSNNFFKEINISEDGSNIEEYDRLMKARRAAIKDEIIRQVKIDLETIENVGIIEFAGEKGAKDYSKLKKNQLDNSIFSELYKAYRNGYATSDANYRVIFEMVARHSVNTIVSNVEFQKLISKDPALYKNNEDEIKRLGGYNSTGSNSRNDFPNNHWINSDENTCKDGAYNVVELEDVYTRYDMYDTLFDMNLVNYKNDFTRNYTAYSSFEELPDDYSKSYKYPDGTEVIVTKEWIADKAKKMTEDQLATYGYNELKNEKGEVTRKASKLKDGTNISDASVIISPMMYKNIMMRWGEWTQEVEEAFDLLENETSWLRDKDLHAKALNVIMRPLKYVYMGDEFTEDFRNLGIYDKMALFPLFKAMAVSGDMKHIYDRMKSTQDKPIHMFKFQSATKLGGKQKFKTYLDETAKTLSNFFGINKDMIYAQYFKYLRNQLVTDPHDVDRTLTGTQFIKSCLSNIVKSNIYDNIVIKGLDKVRGSDIIKEVMQSINALSNKGVKTIYEDFKVDIDSEGNVTLSEEALSKLLIKDAQNSNMSSDLIESFRTEDGKFKIPLSSLSESTWIEQKFISFINKTAIDIRMPGNAFIQQSPFGFQTVDINQRITVSSDEGRTLNNGESLKFRNTRTGATECMISINLFNHVFPKSIKDEPYDTKVKWLVANKLIGPDADPIAMGYRIPTQGQSSIDALLVMDVFPSNTADTIMLPYEFTKKNGSDFDVDKLFVARYNYEEYNTGERKVIGRNDKEIDVIKRAYTEWKSKSIAIENGEVVTNISRFDKESTALKYFIENEYKKGVKYDTETATLYRNVKGVRKVEFDDTISDDNGNKWNANSREACENRMIDCYIALLTSNHHVHEARASIDTVTSSLKKDVLEEIEKLTTSTINKTAFYGVSMSFHLKKKMENMLSKNGIGPFALNNVHHVLTQLYDIGIRNFIANDPKYNIKDLSGIYGEDGVRILDWLSAMINAHVDAAKDPYITRLNVVPFTYNMVNLLLRSGKGKSTFFFLKQPIISDLVDLDRNYGSTMSLNEKIETIRNKYEKMLDGAETGGAKFDTGYIFNYNTLYSLLNNQSNTKNWINAQLEMLEAYKELTSCANELAEFVSVTQVDTKKYGNTNTKLRMFRDKQKKFLYDQTPRKGHIPIFTGIDEFFNNSFIGTKTENSVQLMLKLFKKYLLSGSEIFEILESDIFRSLNRRFSANDKLTTSVYNGISALLKSSFMNEKIVYSFVMKDLLYGDDCLSKRLFKLKNDILNGVYPGMLDRDGNIANDFIKSLIPDITTEDDSKYRPNLIRVSKGSSSDVDVSDRIISAWDDLFTHPDENMRKFAEDMVIYAFYASADNPDLHRLFNLVPSSKKLEYGFGRFNPSSFNKDNILDRNEIFRNNWYDDSLVQKVYKLGKSIEDYVYIGGEAFSTVSEDNQKVNTKIPIVLTLANAIPCGNNKKGQQVYKPFVKIEFQTGRPGYESTMLYRFIGVTSNGVDSKPIYALTYKKGFKDVDEMRFTEYTSGQSIFEFNKITNKQGSPLLYGDMELNPDYLRKSLASLNPDESYNIDYYSLADRDVTEEPFEEIYNKYVPQIETTETDDVTVVGDTSLENIESNPERIEVKFSQYGTDYTFFVQNGIVVDHYYKQGAYGAENKLNPKNVQSKYEELATNAKKVKPVEAKIDENLNSYDADNNIITLNGIEIDLKKLGYNFNLNDDQISALYKLADWYKRGEGNITLEGAAGTGKSTITNIIAKYIEKSKGTVKLTAMTHRAVIVLKSMNKGATIKTVASLFGFRPYADLNGTEFVQAATPDAKPGDTVFIDEVSMLNSTLYNMLEKYSKENGIRLIYIGDSRQLMPVKDTEISKVFTETKSVLLTKVERQSGTNPLLLTLDHIRDYIDKFMAGNQYAVQRSLIRLSRFAKDSDSKGIFHFNIGNRKFLDLAIPLFRKSFVEGTSNLVKILCFTNDRVSGYNKFVRKGLGIDAAFVPGEIMMAYRTLMKGKEVISYNASDYIITNVSEPIDVEYSYFGKKVILPVYRITYKDLNDDEADENTISLIAPIGDTLEERDKNFKEVYDKTYKFITEVMTTASDIYKSGNPNAGKMYKEMKEYLDNSLLTSFKLNDIKVEGKEYSHEKAMDYGYACTVHKSQGSTIKYTFVDETDFDAHTTPLLALQLRYVAYSRSTDATIVNTLSNASVTNDEFKNPLAKNERTGILETVSGAFLTIEQLTQKYVKLFNGITSFATGESIGYSEQQSKPVESTSKQSQPTTTSNNPSDYTNHSGGAYGGDTYWDLIGREYGVTDNRHYRDSGNTGLSKQLKNKGVSATVLSKEQMDKARSEVERLLGKKYPDTTEGNLQVRNYYQVANSDAVFAIAKISGDAKSNSGTVLGGTNTAVQLGIKLGKPVYVWDITSEQWMVFTPEMRKDGDIVGKFVPTSTPVLTKNFAGVGSRDIENYNTLNKTTNQWESRKQYLGIDKENAAKQAIRDVFENTLKQSDNTNKQLELDSSEKALLVKLKISEQEFLSMSKEEQDRLFGCNK